MKKQSGIALITILLIVTIVTVITAEMAFDHGLNIARTANRLNHLHIDQYVLGAEQLTATILKKDGTLKEKTDSPSDIWAQKNAMAFPLPNGAFIGEIIDQDGKININDIIVQNTINTDTQTQLSRLFKLLELDSSKINAIIDWIDTDQNATFPGGAEDGYYLALETPYRTANAKFNSINELILLNGFDQTTVDLLKPHITALPEKTTINVNTASNLVLQTLAPHINEKIATDFIDDIIENPFQSVDAFKNHSNNKDKPNMSDNLNTKSQYFLSKIQVKIAETIIQSSTLMKRDQNNNITIINRTLDN